MQTLGTAASPERYARFTIKERILREIERRLVSRDWSFATVQWDKIVRYPIPEDYQGRSGPVLALIDGMENFGITTTGYQNECEIQLEFGILPGAEESGSTLLNLILGDLLERVVGDHKLREGGKEDGQELSCTFYPESFEPSLETAPGQVVRGLLTMKLTYRHKTHKPFDLR